MPWHRWSYVSNYVTIHIHPNIFCIDTYTNTSRAADQNRQSGLMFLFLGRYICIHHHHCLDWKEAHRNHMTSDQVECGDHHDLAHPKASVLSMFPH
ncbi:hypothetical protein PVAP13_1NG418538 [Panicum virgatum]|uniref:Uncharacterized protein n=1 Tax=Panicum virgatum TaxID=38727 RepID=A0A8T0X5B1_PANVG|nr:hypothetical protein PVAP13_1NG418538 [Panicum virgatum]